MKSETEIIFGLIAEEFNPPPAPKPLTLPQVKQIVNRVEQEAFRGGVVNRRSGPMRQLIAAVMVNDEMRDLDSEDLERYVRDRITRQLVGELIQYLEVEKDFNISSLQTRYFARLYVAFPKDMRTAPIPATMEEYAAEPIKSLI